MATNNCVTSEHTLSSYPRAQPYVPPQQPALLEARLRRWTILLAGSAAALLVVTVAAVVLLLNLASQRPGPVAAPEPQAVAADKKPVTVAQPVTQPAADPVPRERFLEALGVITGAHIYQSYLNIGLLADGVEGEAFTAAEAETMLTKVTQQIEMVERQLAQFTKTGLDEDDRAALEATCSLAARLRIQAATLRAYWQGGTKEQADLFHQVREQVWAELSESLGIED
jgi:hypothetical protein